MAKSSSMENEIVQYRTSREESQEEQKIEGVVSHSIACSHDKKLGCAEEKSQRHRAHDPICVEAPLPAPMLQNIAQDYKNSRNKDWPKVTQ